MKQLIVIPLITCLLFTYAFSSILGDLSDVPRHAESAVHDATFDQQAFLGKDGVEEFSKLSPEEGKARLQKMMKNRVDLNKDGRVTKDELKAWVAYIEKKWIKEEADKAWKDYNHENKSQLDFQTYSNSLYGDRLSERYSGEELERVKKDIELDKAKWKAADKNGDDMLDRSEFSRFIRPEEYSEMKPFLIDELLLRADKNKDGYLDIDEFTDELYARDGNIKRGVDPEPEWIKLEIEQFSIHRDSNKDGKMDRNEVGEWIIPSNYDGPESESLHLMHHADTDKDGELSMEEIMSHSDLFVSSQATNYGESLVNNKEEL